MPPAGPPRSRASAMPARRSSPSFRSWPSPGGPDRRPAVHRRSATGRTWSATSRRRARTGWSSAASCSRTPSPTRSGRSSATSAPTASTSRSRFARWLAVIPWQWQQFVQQGLHTSLDDWLRAMLDAVDATPPPTFWHRQRHDRLVARWADVVGAEHTDRRHDRRDGCQPAPFACSRSSSAWPRGPWSRATIRPTGP